MTIPFSHASLEELSKFVKCRKAFNMSENEKTNSKVFSILAMVLGGLSLLVVPIVLGPAAIILAVVGLVKKEKLAPIGLAVAILGMLVGMFLGAIVGMALFG